MKLTSERVTTKVLPAHVTGNGVALSKKRWLVAQVRIYHEKKTSERLTKMGIENYVPVQRKTRIISVLASIVSLIVVLSK